MEPLTMTKEREAEIRQVGRSLGLHQTNDLLTELDATREALQQAEQNVQRFSNPWTVEILNQKDNQWSEFCYDAPLTLADAEKREGELKAEHPDAKFRVVPWFNSAQRQTIQRERELADQLAAALDKSQADICGYLCTPTWQVANGRPHHPICQSVSAALAQHAAVRSGK